MNVSCTTCALFMQCRLPDKGPSYSCAQWTSIDYGIDLRAMFPSRRAAPVPQLPGPVRASNASRPLDSFDLDYATLKNLASEDDDESAERSMYQRLDKLMADAMQPDVLSPPDFRIDDGDLPLAANFYEFTTGRSFLNHPPYPKQLIIFTHLFGEWCPRCSAEVAKDVEEFPKDYPLDDIEEVVTFLRHGTCPSCSSTQAELMNSGELPVYQELAMPCGMRAGKSIGIALAQTYQTHRFLKVQNLAFVYKQSTTTLFTGSMIGITFNRAKFLLFTPFMSAINKSPWFQEYHKLLDHYSKTYGSLYTAGKEMLVYQHRNLAVHPASPSKRTLRGDTRLWATCDEIGFFPFKNTEDRERAGADEVYDALDRSLLTIRLAAEKLRKQGLNAINAFGLYLSSPSAANDKIMTLAETFRTSKHGMTVHLASWEMSPDIDRDSSIIVDAFNADSVAAARDYVPGRHCPAALTFPTCRPMSRSSPSGRIGCTTSTEPSGAVRAPPAATPSAHPTPSRRPRSWRSMPERRTIPSRWPSETFATIGRA